MKVQYRGLCTMVIIGILCINLCNSMKSNTLEIKMNPKESKPKTNRLIQLEESNENKYFRPSSNFLSFILFAVILFDQSLLVWNNWSFTYGEDGFDPSKLFDFIPEPYRTIQMVFFGVGFISEFGNTVIKTKVLSEKYPDLMEKGKLNKVWAGYQERRNSLYSVVSSFANTIQFAFFGFLLGIHHPKNFFYLLIWFLAVRCLANGTNIIGIATNLSEKTRYFYFAAIYSFIFPLIFYIVTFSTYSKFAAIILTWDGFNSFTQFLTLSRYFINLIKNIKK